MRDRLIGLLDKVQLHGVDLPVDRERYPSDEVSVSNEQIADYLLANGVIVPPCKVGDTVYEIVCDDPFLEDSKLSVVNSTVCEFVIYTTEEMHNMKSVDKTFFLSREDAEKALEALEDLRGENNA